MVSITSRIGSLTVALLFLVAAPSQVVAEITDTAFYRAARKAHEEDVANFGKTVSRILNAIASNQLEFPDPEESTEESEVINFVKRIESVSEKDERASIQRIRYATNKRDLFRDGIVNWLRDLEKKWVELKFVTPEDKTNNYLPRPYKYHSTLKVEQYLSKANNKVLNATDPEEFTVPPSFSPQLPEDKDLSYNTSVTRPPPFDSSFVITLTDFLIDRAIREAISSALEHTRNNLDNGLAALVPSMEIFLTQTQAFNNLSAIIPAFRSAAAEDLRNLPKHLLTLHGDYLKLHNGEAQHELLRLVFATLESIRSGTAPSVALAKWHKDGTPCTWNSVLGVVANE